MALAARGSRTLSLPRAPLLEMSCRAARFVSREDDMRQVGYATGVAAVGARRARVCHEGGVLKRHLGANFEEGE